MPIKIHAVMTREVVTAGPDMTLTELDRLLVSENVSGGPVVEDGVVVGVVSRADVIRVLYDEQMAAANVSGFYGSPYPIPIPALYQLARDSRRIADEMTNMRVSQIMSRDVKSSHHTRICTPTSSAVTTGTVVRKRSAQLRSPSRVREV